MSKIDYTNFSKDGPKDERNTLTSRWWTLNEEEMAAAIAGTVKYLQEHQSGVESQRQISSRLYGNMSLMGINGVSVSKVQNSQSQQRISYNVVQSGLDTIVAKMRKNKPKPLFLTSGAKWKLQRKAKKLDKFVEGVFYENQAYEMGPDALRDGGVWGDGFVHVFNHNSRVKYERVLPSELLVDQMEAFYGNPRQLHRVKNIDRLVACDMFPEHKEYLMQVNGALVDTTGSISTIGDPITMAESWHLKSGPEATDGKHAITVNGKVLFIEEWERDVFPFVRFQWSKRLYGYWSQGGAEQVQSIQLEINKLLWVIQRSMHIAGTFKVAMENSSKIVKEALNNDIGSIITYTNNPPQYLVPPIVQPEIYQHLQTLKTAAYEQLGVSQLSASSQKPAGLNSGKALREYNDIESDRFMSIGQAYEQFFLDLAKHTVAVAQEIYEEEGSFSVNVPGKKFIESIDWKDVDMDDDQYVLRLYPISALSDDPADRLETIQEYAQAGFIQPNTARRLLDFPDLDAVEEMANAPEDRIHKCLESMLDDGEPSPPDEYMPLDLARSLALQYYNHAVVCDVDEERLELVRTFMKQIDALEMQMNPPPPVGMPVDPSQVVAPANPTPTPQSDLVPNVNA